jgi:N-acetylglucosaminyl-diphospho-decaprenol L-rhamnosyltransferase
MSTSVAVIVPLFNGRELISDCLDSIPRGTEIVVVDDGSSDGAPELVEQDFPFVRLLRNERNLGFGSTANRGLCSTSATVRVVLNSDARLRPGALEALVREFEADEGVGIAGPRLVFPDDSHQTSAASFPTIGSIITGSFLLNDLYRAVRPNAHFRWELGMARRDHDTTHDVEWVKGACLTIRDRCFVDTGGFDSSYYMYAEETDLCWRAQQASWTVRYVADATVEHLGGGSTGDPSVHARRMLKSERLLMKRIYGEGVERRWRMARAAGAATKIVVLAPAALVSRRARLRFRWQASALRISLARSDQEM